MERKEAEKGKEREKKVENNILIFHALSSFLSSLWESFSLPRYPEDVWATDCFPAEKMSNFPPTQFFNNSQNLLLRSINRADERWVQHDRFRLDLLKQPLHCHLPPLSSTKEDEKQNKTSKSSHVPSTKSWVSIWIAYVSKGSASKVSKFGSPLPGIKRLSNPPEWPTPKTSSYGQKRTRDTVWSGVWRKRREMNEETRKSGKSRRKPLKYCFM